MVWNGWEVNTQKVQKFLKFAEKLAIKYSDYLVADSIGIQKYLKISIM